MPLPELQHRLSNLTSLDRCYGQLHASPADLQRLLVQLQGERAQPCTLMRLLSAWPAEQHDALQLRSPGWRNWAAFTGLTPSSAMTQAENPYRQDVFLRMIFGSRRIVSSSASGLNTSRCSSRFCSAVVLHHLPPCSTSAAGRCVWFGPDSPAQRRLVLRAGHQSPARSPLVRRCCARPVFPNKALHPVCFRPVRAHPGRSAGTDRLCQFGVQPSHAEFDLHGSAAVADRAGPIRCALCHVLRLGARYARGLSPIRATSGGRQFETYPHQDPYHYPPCLAGSGAAGWVSP